MNITTTTTITTVVEFMIAFNSSENTFIHNIKVLEIVTNANKRNDQPDKIVIEITMCV